MKTSDKILTFVALFISCLALVVSIVQTRILQKQSQAAVWPRIDILNSYSKEHYKIFVANQGVGPAIIKHIEYAYEDTLTHRIVDLIKYIARNDESKNESSKLSFNLGYAEILKGRVLKPSESLEIFNAKDSVSLRLAHKYLEKVDIKIDYCSIYDNCWRLKDDNILELN